MVVLSYEENELTPRKHEMLLRRLTGKICFELTRTANFLPSVVDELTLFGCTCVRLKISSNGT